MKTTVEIPDSLYRQVKARAALQGKSIKDFLVEAVRAKIKSETVQPKEKQNKKGWRAVFGAADPKDVAEVQRIIDEEFSKIDPEGW
jgi:plasmid stability protein